MLYALDLSEPLCCGMFGRMMQKNGWHRKYVHKNANHLLVFVISGCAEFSLEGICVPVCAGDVLLIPAGTAYTANTADQCEYYFFRFSGGITILTEVPGYPVMEPSVSFVIPQVSEKIVAIAQKTKLQEDHQKFYQCIISCMEYTADMALSSRLALDVELQKILLLLARIQERNTAHTAFPMALGKMLAYIRRNLTGPIAPSQVCADCGISASYGARLFRRYLNTTLSKYILGEKLHYACELMNSTGMNISQIADYLGFCDVFYFSKCFKDMFGKSPTQMFRGDKN